MNSLTWWYVLKTSWRYLCKTSWWCLEDIFKTSWRSIEDNPQDVLKTVWRRLKDVLARRLEDVLKTFLQDVLKRSWKLLEDVWKTNGQDGYIGIDQPRRLEGVLKASSEDVSLRRTYSSLSRPLEDSFKTSSEDKDERRLQDFFKRSSSRRMFPGKYQVFLWTY